MPKVKVNDSIRIHTEAVQAGLSALNACVPTPMIVQQHTNPLNDNSPVVKSYFVEDGCCGFAWVKVKADTPANRKFINGLKSAGLLANSNVVFTTHTEWSKCWDVGYSYWVHYGNQSLSKKEAFADAFARVLRDNGITAYSESRMD